MDGGKHGRQTLGMALEMVANEVTRVGQQCVIPHCDNHADVAYALAYKGAEYAPGERSIHWSRWLCFCEQCDEDKDLAPYWWNKALRGESLEDEDE